MIKIGSGTINTGNNLDKLKAVEFFDQTIKKLHPNPENIPWTSC